MKELKIVSYTSLIIFIILILNSLLGDIVFRLSYLNPKVSLQGRKPLSAQEFPIQNDIPESEQTTIEVRAQNNKVYKLKTQAEYSVTGMVVATNTNFFLRNVMRNKFDDVCLMDIGLVWGDIANREYIQKYLKFKSSKTLGSARQLTVTTKNSNGLPHRWGYITSHMGHTHLIPKNSNIMSSLLTIKKNDIVKLDGYLVDIYTDAGEIVAKTSLSRFDNNATSRGYGACEDMYVTQVQIGNRIYR